MLTISNSNTRLIISMAHLTPQMHRQENEQLRVAAISRPCVIQNIIRNLKFSLKFNQILINLIEFNLFKCYKLIYS